MILYKVGNLRLKAGHEVLARSAFEESVAVGRKLVERDPGNLLAQRDLARSLSALGEGKRALGDPGGALAAHQEALAIRRKLAAQAPDDAGAWADLAASLTAVARVSDEPAPLYREALALLEGLDATNRLSVEQQGWILWVKDQLAALPEDRQPGVAGESSSPP